MIVHGADATITKSKKNITGRILLYGTIGVLVIVVLIAWFSFPKDIINQGSPNDVVRVSVFLSRDTPTAIPPPYGDSLRKVYIDTDLQDYSSETKAFSYVYQMDDELKDYLTTILFQYKIRPSFTRIKESHGYHIRYYLSNGEELTVFIGVDDAATSYIKKKDRYYKILKCVDFQKTGLNAIDKFLNDEQSAESASLICSLYERQ